MNHTKKAGNPLEELLSQTSTTFSSEYGSVMDFYLSSTIGEPSEYIDWFHKIRNARKSDIINIHINCPGGNLFTTVQFLQVLSECEAHIIMNVAGSCMSAATLIFLMGDEFIVNEHSAFLFHNYSGGMIGKGGEMYHNMVHDRKWSERLFRSQYEHFLTPEEISNLVDDKDIWMDAETVVKRLESRGEAILSSETEQAETETPLQVEQPSEKEKKQTKAKATTKAVNVKA